MNQNKPKNAIHIQVELMGLASQILELDLSSLEEALNKPYPSELSAENEAVMQEGVLITQQLLQVFQRFQQELTPLEQRLNDWNPPPELLEAFMKKGPPPLE